MGCCKSTSEINQEILSENLEKHDQIPTQTEEGFGDLSIDSNRQTNNFPISNTQPSLTKIYKTRSTSLSLKTVGLESAFLHSS